MEQVILIDSKYCSADSGIIKLIEIREDRTYMPYITAENDSKEEIYKSPRELSIFTLNIVDIFTKSNSLFDIAERVNRLKPNY